MILVTLGTQDKQFKRLLIEIDRLIDARIIKDKVVVQKGMTEYESNNMELFDLLPKDRFDKLIDEASLIITHGGVGSIMAGLNKGKKVIAVPRLVKYGEHQSDHQVEIINRFNESGYIMGIDDVSKLENAYKKIDKFKPKRFDHNNDLMIKKVTDYIKDGSKVMFISSTGGHLEELLQFSKLFNKYNYYLVTEKTKSGVHIMRFRYVFLSFWFKRALYKYSQLLRMVQNLNKVFSKDKSNPR